MSLIFSSLADSLFSEDFGFFSLAQLYRWSFFLRHRLCGGRGALRLPRGPECPSLRVAEQIGRAHV